MRRKPVSRWSEEDASQSVAAAYVQRIEHQGATNVGSPRYIDRVALVFRQDTRLLPRRLAARVTGAGRPWVVWAIEWHESFGPHDGYPRCSAHASLFDAMGEARRWIGGEAAEVTWDELIEDYRWMFTASLRRGPEAYVEPRTSLGD